MKYLSAAIFTLGFAFPVFADDWQDTLQAARGQTVYWNAWGGDSRTNEFIAWVGEQTAKKFKVNIRHVKLSDTAEAVTRVISEKAAGKDKGGSVDLVWINGPNFLAMKEQDLLHGPFVSNLPNAKYLDLAPNSANAVDFSVPVDGMETPWRLAKFVFNYNSANIQNPPRNMTELKDWAAENPGRFTHPDPANFMGATFLKQALIELTPNPDILQKPANDANFDTATAPLWEWYDTLRPHMWRDGEAFPENQFIQQQMMNDNVLDISMSFDPASAAAAVAQGLLPEETRVFVPENGSIGNVSFVAIPYNAAHKEGAKVVANFLLEPATQAHMQNIEVLGSFSVLDPSKLDPEAQARFDNLPNAPALPALGDLGPVLAEPHASWSERLVTEWATRYAQ